MGSDMQKLIAYLMIFVLFTMGILSLYRFFSNSKSFHRIEAKVLEKNLEMVSARSKSYALTFTIAGYKDKIGIYLGTEQQAKADETLRLIDIGKTYLFLLDPTIVTDNNINLGVREILLNEKSVYKSSSTFDLVAGVFCIMLGSLIAFAVRKQRHRFVANASHAVLK